MKQDAKQYVKGCAACQANKINTHPLKPTIFPITPVNGLPFQMIAMDFITKLPKSGKYDTILTITDHDCSKAAIFIPCQETITAEGVVALYVRHVYPRYGILAKVITNRDTRFTLKFAKGLCEALRIKQNISTAYHVTILSFCPTIRRYVGLPPFLYPPSPHRASVLLRSNLSNAISSGCLLSCTI